MKKKVWKRIGWSFCILFLIGNIIVYNHAYQFTHFVDSTISKTKKPEDLSWSEKIRVLFKGIEVPKPINSKQPLSDYKTIYIQSDERLEAWQIDVPNPKGVVILFHGYSSAKFSLVSYAQEFNNLGYSTLLVDFRGSGGSTGNTTTIGFEESTDVLKSFEYIQAKMPKQKVILFGTSMGAVAIMKAVERYDLQADKLILECPFGTMLETTKRRFEAMNLPSFPFAELILIHGGFQIGFNPFKHKPTDYAKTIERPTLVLYGAKDQRVKRQEVDEIYKNLAGEKDLVVFENAGHENYLSNHRKEWKDTVQEFLED